MFERLYWILGKNVKQSGVVYVNIDGIAFTINGIEAMIHNLRARNAELEASLKIAQNAYLRATGNTFRKVAVK